MGTENKPFINKDAEQIKQPIDTNPMNNQALRNNTKEELESNIKNQESYSSNDWKILGYNFILGLIGEFYLAFIEVHSKAKSEELITNSEKIMVIFPL